MTTKSVGQYLVGLGVMAVFVLTGTRSVGGMPSNLPVYVCEETKLMYAPGCLPPYDCAKIVGLTDGKNPVWEQRLEAISLRDAFKKGYTVAPACVAILREYDVSAIAELLDHFGIWKVHPWNPDGSWR